MLINRKLDNYVLLRRLAVGGQSEVFLAMKDGPGEFTRPVVVKALPSEYRHDPKFVELFHREAFLSARFSHPNVVTVHDARILDGEHCMIMDYVAGQTVADVAQRGYKEGDPLTEDQSVRIVADACDGLDYAHHFHDLDETSYPVVHRDVSPQNLMVTYQGDTRVFDFGIAKIVGEESKIDTLAGGKYAYMSPEQCGGDEVDTRSDIFSMGVILYELTVGTRLFRRSTPEEVVEAVTEEEIRPPGDLRSSYPPMLEDVVMKALRRDPDQRYQTAGKMRDDLRDYLTVRGGERERENLGGYVAGLFEEERQLVADVVDRGKERLDDAEPRGDLPLEKLGREDVDPEEVERDPAVPMPDPDEDSNLEEVLEGEEASDGATDPGEAESNSAESAESSDASSNPASESSPEAAASASGERAGQSRESEASRSAERRERRRAEQQLEEMERRQSVMLVALCIVSLVALGLGFLNYFQSGGEGTSDQPVEIKAESAD